MEFSHFMGWDCSKAKLNYCLLDPDAQIVAEGEVPNRTRSIKALLLRLRRRHGLSLEQVLHCVDNTGYYSRPILPLVDELDLFIWLEDPFQISRSIGRTKDKTDEIDARHHAQYALDFRRKAKAWRLDSQIVEQLKQLNRQRLLLVRNRQRTVTSLQEAKVFTLVDFDPVALEVLEQQIAQTTQAITQLEARIDQLIQADLDAARQYQICRSVPGFGPKNTLVVLVVTGLFNRIKTARAAACYAGVSTHQRQSGSSILKRPKTSRAANAELKTALHQGAMSLMNLDNSFGELYRRLRQKGRSHLQAINAVRNKMLRVLYACIEKDTMYCKNLHENLQMP